MSRASGAGAYVQSLGTGARSCFRSRSVNGEVVGALVRPGPLLSQLHEDVVQERGRTNAIAVRCQPVGPERLVDEDQMLYRLLRLTYAARRLEAHGASGLLVHVADRLEHAERDGERRGARDLPGRRLDEVGAGGHCKERRTPHVVVGAELARLEDHLEVRGADGFLHLDDLVVDLRVAAG